MRVFVLGAGASTHAGYPLTKDLGSELIQWANRNPPNWKWTFWPDDEGVREFGPLGDIEEAIARLEQLENPGKFLAGLREALCKYFDSIRPDEAALYNCFAADVVADGDVIITFNYDVSLERELKAAKKWVIRDGYGFQIELPELSWSPVKLLKLHGSTNWIDSLFGGARGGDFGQFDGIVGARGVRPVMLPDAFRSLGYDGVKDPRFDGGGVDRAGSMVLPGRNKAYCVATSTNPREREVFWNWLWGQAEAALRQADEITVIGYSLPTADARARQLLLKESNRHAVLTISCGSQTEGLKDTFVAAGFSRNAINTSFERFEDLLARRPAAQPGRSQCRNDSFLTGDRTYLTKD
jgi:hypothetical protein